MANVAYLTAQLRESVPYLRDQGWRETATLMIAAASEIENLRRELSERNDQILPSQVDRRGVGSA